jgi:hypothetical protein
MGGESEGSLRKWASHTEKGASDPLASPWPYVARVVLASGSTELERATTQLLKYVETLQQPPETPKKLARLDSRIVPEMGTTFAAAFRNIPRHDPPRPEKSWDYVRYVDAALRASIDFACLGYVVGKTASDAQLSDLETWLASSDRSVMVQLGFALRETPQRDLSRLVAKAIAALESAHRGSLVCELARSTNTRVDPLVRWGFDLLVPFGDSDWHSNNVRLVLNYPHCGVWSSQPPLLTVTLNGETVHSSLDDAAKLDVAWPEHPSGLCAMLERVALQTGQKLDWDELKSWCFGCRAPGLARVRDAMGCVSSGASPSAPAPKTPARDDTLAWLRELAKLSASRSSLDSSEYQTLERLRERFAKALPKLPGETSEEVLIPVLEHFGADRLLARVGNCSDPLLGLAKRAFASSTDVCNAVFPMRSLAEVVIRAFEPSEQWRRTALAASALAKYAASLQFLPLTRKQLGKIDAIVDASLAGPLTEVLRGLEPERYTGVTPPVGDAMGACCAVYALARTGDPEQRRELAEWLRRRTALGLLIASAEAIHAIGDVGLQPVLRAVREPLERATADSLSVKLALACDLPHDWLHNWWLFVEVPPEARKHISHKIKLELQYPMHASECWSVAIAIEGLNSCHPGRAGMPASPSLTVEPPEHPTGIRAFLDGIAGQVGVTLDWGNLTVKSNLGGRDVAHRVAAYLASQTSL